MRGSLLLAGVALAILASCTDRRGLDPSASTDLPTSTPAPPAAMPSPAALSSAPSPKAETAPAFSALPPAKPNRAPIRDCEPAADEDAFSCCSEESYAAVERMSKNRSIAECKRIDALPHLAACPTFFARGFHSAIEACMKGAMDRELDRRLVPLKRVDEKAFHREMVLQKRFNDALRETCDEVLLREPSTGDFRGAFRCATFLTELRTRQATAIADQGLEVTHAPAASVKRAKRFRTFANELCALPAWRGGAPPPACEERVLGEIEEELASAAKF